jgi:hypothetical protein
MNHPTDLRCSCWAHPARPGRVEVVDVAIKVYIAHFVTLIKIVVFVVAPVAVLSAFVAASAPPELVLPDPGPVLPGTTPAPITPPTTEPAPGTILSRPVNAARPAWVWFFLSKSAWWGPGASVISQLREPHRYLAVPSSRPRAALPSPARPVE